jgi:glycosyltransferase involved in cell wall biosynthesis
MSQDLRVLHIITRLIVGGAQENTLLSCQGQHDLGHDVTLITGPSLGPEGTLLQRAQAYGYRVEVLDDLRRSILPFKDYRAYRYLAEHLRARRPDIVHTHSSKAGILGRYAAHAAGVPVVLHTIHGLAFTASRRRWVNTAYKTLERRAAPLATRIICVADAMRDQSLAAGIGRPDQYLTIYSGMETAPFLNPPRPRELIRAELGLQPTDIAVGTIARLFHLKGHEDLLALAPDLCRRFPTLKFLWIGDGLLRPDFQRQIAAMNLTDRFILTGLVPPARVPELTAAIDLLVHPSRREGLARAIPQGQLAEKPVLAYDIDGNREGLIDGQTGFLIPPFDRRQLSDRLAILLHDDALRRRFGRAGRRFALARFDSQVMIRALDELYRNELQRVTNKPLNP